MPGASKKLLKKSYRKAAVKHHPDKGSNQENFVIVKEAYDLLCKQGTTKRVEQTIINLGGIGNPFGGVVYERVYYKEGYKPTATEKLRTQLEQTQRDAVKRKAAG